MEKRKTSLFRYMISRNVIIRNVICMMLVMLMMFHPSVGILAEAASTVKLTSLKYADAYYSMDILVSSPFKSGFVTTKNVAYTNNFIFFDAIGTNSHVTYNLNGKYTKLTGKIVTSRETGEGVYEVSFLGDNKLLKSCKYTKDDYRELDVSINVKGITQLTIKAQWTKGPKENGYIFFAEPILTKASSPPDYDYTPSATPLKIKGKTATVSFSKLKKNAQKLPVSRIINFISKGKGKLTYRIISANKGGKSYKNYFKINKKTGKVTIKKGLKKGTYKIKIKVTAAGDENYKAGSKTAMVTVRVRK